jgi:hypothetical protein
MQGAYQLAEERKGSLQKSMCAQQKSSLCGLAMFSELASTQLSHFERLVREHPILQKRDKCVLQVDTNYHAYH